MKRSISRAASPAIFHPQSPSIPSPLKQPATVLAKDPSLLSPISAQRPTTNFESECDSDFQVYGPRPVASWKVFFTAKKHNSRSTRSIKRIYPHCLHHPTLVLARVISDEPSDTNSVYSGQSIYYDSHSPTSVMPQFSTHESPASSPVQGIKIRRSFSISNILHSPRLPSRHSRRHSSAPAHHWFPQPTPYHTPSENFPPSPLPRPYTSEFQHLPPIQSVSVLNIDIEPEPFRIPLSSNDAESSSDSSSDSGRLEGESADKNNSEITDNDNILQNDSIYRPHRLSILTNAGSERASTLIGSDDGLDRGTENVFDSVRTRVNEGVTPVRVESIFDLSSSSPDMTSPLGLKKNRGVPYVDEIGVSPTSDVYRGLTPPPVKVDGWLANRQDDADDINWGSDWESSKNPKAENTPLAVGGIPMITRRSESSAAILKSTLRDNGSRSSFEDWNTEWEGDSHSNLGSSPTAARGAATWRLKTKGKSASLKEGPNLSHSRSQSLPVRTARHMPSENWDDDFGFEEDGLGLGTEVVVPQAIQDRQQKVLRHLDAVKEFAALVEELKRLMDLALSTGSRWGACEKMWDEAEGVIALASTGNADNEDERDLKEEPRGRQRDSERSALSSLNDEFSDEEEDVKLVMEEENRSSTVTITARRASSLLADDDVFGGGNVETIFTESSAKHKTPFERQTSRHVKSYSTSSSDSRKGAGLTRSDPVAMARSMMERMQRSSSDSLHSPTMASNNGTLQFDTKMLGPLLDKVKILLTGLESSLKDEGHFGRDNHELGFECGGT